MANRTMRALILLLITVLLGILISGCTVAGLLVGARIDRRNAKAHRVSWDSVSSVPRGRAVHVTLTSGDTLCGKFTGLRTLPLDSYRCAYDSVRRLPGNDSVLPALGETIHLVLATGRRIDGAFRSLDAGALAVRPHFDRRIEYVSMPTITRLQDRGRSLDVDRLRALVSTRTVPSGRMFVVQAGEQTCRIPLQHIQEVYAPPQHTRKWLLYGGIGLAVDAAIITAIGVAIEQSIPNIGTITI
jgi:hypothetical protein